MPSPKAIAAEASVDPGRVLIETIVYDPRGQETRRSLRYLLSLLTLD